MGRHYCKNITKKLNNKGVKSQTPNEQKHQRSKSSKKKEPSHFIVRKGFEHFDVDNKADVKLAWLINSK